MLFCREVLKDSVYKQVTSKNLDLEVRNKPVTGMFLFFWSQSLLEVWYKS